MNADQQLEYLKQQINQLQLNQITPEVLEELRRQITLLGYLRMERIGFTASSPSQVGNPVCSAAGCKAGWKEGLVNFASPQRDPVWYCLRHGEIELSQLLSAKLDDEAKGSGGSLPGWPHPLEAKIQNAQHLLRSAMEFLRNHGERSDD